MDRNNNYLLDHLGFARKREKKADAETFTTMLSLAFLAYCLALYAFGG